MTTQKLSDTKLKFAVLTVSDTRDSGDDRSGDILEKLLRGAGHYLSFRAIVQDNREEIAAYVKKWVDDPSIDIVLTTGGTGLTGRDVTPEAVEPLFNKPIPGFGELFRLLSFQKIGPAAIQSRATAGIANGKYIFALPGSPSACQDAWELILRDQFDQQSKSCSFVSLIPRLNEAK